MDKVVGEETYRSLERASLLSLCLYEHLLEKGMDTLAREAMVLSLGTSHALERLGEALGIDPVPPASMKPKLGSVFPLRRA